MLIIILLLILGTFMAYISKFNSMLVSVDLVAYTFNDIPLFYVIIASLLTGLILSYLVYLVDLIFTTWTLRGKEKQIKKSKSEILELTKRVHQLELENEKLKNGTKEETEDPNSL